MSTQQQKFSKEELENSKRIQKSATPKYTLDWYVKWIASLFILDANFMFAFGLPLLNGCFP